MKNYMNEYEAAAVDFLNKYGAKMKICFSEVVDRFPGDTCKTGYRNKYKITISRDHKSYTFAFYDSINAYNNNERPSKYDILACVEKYEVYGDLWDFASEYGYEINNRESFQNVQRIYNACKMQYNKLLRLFGEEGMNDLQEIN